MLSPAASGWFDLRRRRCGADGDARRTDVLAVAGRIPSQDHPEKKTGSDVTACSKPGSLNRTASALKAEAVAVENALSTLAAAAHLRSKLYWQAAVTDRCGRSRRTSQRANHVHRPAPVFQPAAFRNACNASRDKPGPCRYSAAASITAPF